MRTLYPKKKRDCVCDERSGTNSVPTLTVVGGGCACGCGDGGSGGGGCVGPVDPVSPVGGFGGGHAL